MVGGGAPQAPDPTQTANAQTKSNKETAITQSGLNMVDQTTPFGSLNYDQIGKWDDGTPRFEATQTLAPGQQQLFETGQRTSQNLADLAEGQSTRLQGLLAEPFDLSNESTESSIVDRYSQRLNPQLDRRRESLRTQLLNQGVMPGSEAYTRAMGDFGETENDAWNQLFINARGQSVNEALMQRNQPINEIIGLASGTQVQQPNFVGTPQTGVAGTDVAGITQQGYNNQMNAYNQQQQQQNQMLGGLFSAGASLAPFLLSDRRAKENIKRIGKTNDNQKVYSWTYKGDDARTTHVGLMAQEVAKKTPEAVANIGGLLAVDYGKALEGAA